MRRQLKELKQRRTEDVLSHVSCAEIVKSELRGACGENMPDDAFAHYLRNGLSKAHAAFVQQVRFGNENRTLDALKTRLLSVKMTVKKEYHDEESSLSCTSITYS